jgi:hypothetical protein
MEITGFPADFRPIIQPIDTWFLSRRLAMMFEAKIGNGKLMVCSIDLDNNLDTRIAARQMKLSILNYMNSEKFNPTYDLSKNFIQSLFVDKEHRDSFMNTNDAPDEIKFNLLNN